MSPLQIDVACVRRALSSRTHLELESKTGQRAAVAAILRDCPGGAELLLIRRAAREGDPWSGHMALPGGRQQPEDADIFQTAVRETLEEVGLDLSKEAALIGRLDVIEAVSRMRRVGLTISPFVFAVEGEPELHTNVEVEEVLWTPLAPLFEGTASTSMHYDVDGSTLKLPAWDVRGRIVWGLTYRMLQGLFEALLADS